MPWAWPSAGQTRRASRPAVVQGTVCDSQRNPVKDANVSLESEDHARQSVTRSDEQGHYRFNEVAPGSYTLRVSKAGYVQNADRPLVVKGAEPKIVDVRLSKNDSTDFATNALPVSQFSDEPRFQVAGIADPSNYGGHGSDVALRTKEALARDTSSLNQETTVQPTANSATVGDAAELHRWKGDTAEKEGRSLEAVREYELAAELRPSEAHLFAWGAELLLHRAFEPATEVFAKGHRLFPHSVRMAVGLSIATYSQGMTERGEQLLLEASDINPADPAPYSFMGRLQEAERIPLPGWMEKLRRFSLLDPNNPMAHYYYAVALSKENRERQDDRAVEVELKRAIALDPQLGQAYLRLGILYAANKDNPAAIATFEKAIENSSLPDEAHYRLAEIYRQMGNTDKARAETALYTEVSQQKTRQAEEQRHAIQQFVYTLRAQPTDTAPSSKPH